MSDNEKPQFDTARTTLALNTAAAPAADPMQADEARMRRALGLYGDQPRQRPAQERSDPAPRSPERFAGPGHKRRFVHDGEVPVTLVHGLVSGRRDHADGNGSRGAANPQPTNRLEIAEAALTAEIATRERAERALQEAQAVIHDLQTKLGHAELARQEAVETLRREREASAELRASLQQAEEAAAVQAQAAAEARAAAEAQAAIMKAEPAAEQAQVVTGQMLAESQESLAATPEQVEVEGLPPRPRRGRRPRAQLPMPTEVTAPVAKPRKAAAAGRTKEAAPTREPKPIRWWLQSGAKKKR